MEILNLIAPYSNYLIPGLLTLLIIFVKSYVSEKGKLTALESKNKELVKQSESIKSQYSKELEELKKEHQLDISKRRYKYESKKDTYIKFFQLIDQFTREQNIKNQESMILIIDEFNKKFLNAVNSKDKTLAITLMSKKAQKLMIEANDELLRVKQETNTIRLIASSEILDKLNQLDIAYERSLDLSNKMMTSLPKNIMTNDTAKLEEEKYNVELSAQLINKIKDNIISLMRTELDEI